MPPKTFFSAWWSSTAARAAEEPGLVRWLRLEFQSTIATQAGLGVEMEEEEHPRVRAVCDCLMQTPSPVAPEVLARSFIRARVPEVTAILHALAALGQAARDEGCYRA